jgi:DHA2 family multidrug resistance protein
LLWPIIITGFALSFVFVPITTQSYGTLRNEQIGNASGIFNLVRNIGGSIGISVAQTLLTRRSDYHQSQITNYVPQTQIWLQQQTSNLSRPLAQYFNPSNAMPAALATLYRDLVQQAQLWAFVDVFRWMALLCFGCVPLVWLFRKVRSSKNTAAVH